MLQLYKILFFIQLTYLLCKFSADTADSNITKNSPLSGNNNFTDILQLSKSFGLQLQEAKKSEFNISYSGAINASKTDSYEFNYNISNDYRTAVRISTVGLGGSTSYPVMIVVRQERSVMSWQIPLVLQYTFQYSDVSRTLCPLDSTKSHPIHPDQKIFIDISSLSPTNMPYVIFAEILEDFLLRGTREVSSSPSKPVYYMYNFTEGVESVMVWAKSADTTCAVLSIQDVNCPVFDLDTDVVYQGKYQTMTTQGAIVVNKSDYRSGKFYIVLVVKPNDEKCSNGFITMNPAGIINIQQKNFTITVIETLASSKYYKATLAAVGLFLAFYLVALCIAIFYHSCKDNWGVVDLNMHDTPSASVRREPLVETSAGSKDYGSINRDGTTADSVMKQCTNFIESENNREDDGSISSINSDDYDNLADAQHDKNVIRAKAMLYVCDLARKSERKSNKAYRLYAMNLLTITIFYGLPVVQLVMTYQKVLNFTGNQDMCYYNFACAHPAFGRFSSFNNIFSNIGYIMLGLLFLILVKRRSILFAKAVEKSGGRHKKVGIPQHFGLFYAMGLAMCMEGIMSACYHVCPTVSNFQFDTSFMYIMACLCILKIYQNRHPDIGAKAHSSYFVMAVVILVAVIGVVYGNNVFWIIFAIMYIGASLILSIHIYYLGLWNLDRHICHRLWILMKSDWLRVRKPVYMNRFILLLLGNCVNWAIAIYGAVKAPPDFASLLLAVFIANLLLYTTYYIIMKIFAHERIAILTVVLIILAAVSWAFALYFFFSHLTSWQLSPAKSREGNQKCLLFEFYDKHDIWHFISAISLFFSFLILLTLDDEIYLKRRDQIPVF